MLTIPEFREAVRRYNRRVAVGCLGVILAAPVLAMGPVFAYGAAVAPPGVPPGQAVPDWMFLASFVAFVVLLFGGLIAVGTLLDHDDRVRCPHCRATLAAPGAVAAAISSRHCVHCGRRALAEPPDTGSPILTADRAAVLAGDAGKIPDQFVRPAALAFGGSLAVMVPLVLFRDTIREWLSPELDRHAVATLFTGVLLAPVLIGGAWIAWLGHKAERGIPVCPHCRSRLRIQLWFVAATGNCISCGGRVAEPPPDPPGPITLSVADVAAARRAVSRSAWLRLGAGVTGTFVALLAAGVAAAGGRKERFLKDVERDYGLVRAATAEAAIGGAVALAAMGCFLGGVIWAVRVEKRTPPRLVCPHCQTPVGGVGLVVATKRCTNCRRRIVADPEPPAGAV